MFYRVSELLDYTADEMTGQSLYNLVHGEDVHKMRKTHEDLLNKGQVMSNYYRMMNKQGGYCWMQSCATLICNTKNSDEQSIICVNYVLSGPQCATIVMDQCQVPGAKLGGGTTTNNLGDPSGEGLVPGGIRIKEDFDDEDTHDKKGNLKRPYRGSELDSSGSNGNDSLGGGGSNASANWSSEDMRGLNQGYAGANSSSKDWPFWRPPTLI